MRALLLTLLVLAAAASASRIENATGEHYQHDGGKPGDAPDTCGDPRSIPLTGSHSGMLVPGDDARDFWLLEVSPNEAEFGVFITLQPIGYTPVVSSAVPADLYVHGQDRETGAACGQLFAKSTNPGSLPDQVVVDVPGIYHVEARLPPPYGVGVGGLPPTQAPSACHPMCAQDTYNMVRG